MVFRRVGPGVSSKRRREAEMKITINDNGFLIEVEIPKDKETAVHRFLVSSLNAMLEDEAAIRTARAILKEKGIQGSKLEPSK